MIHVTDYISSFLAVFTRFTETMKEVYGMNYPYFELLWKKNEICNRY